MLRGDLTVREAFTDPEHTAALFSGAAEVRRAGEGRSAAEARQAAERFDGWQRERHAEHIEDEHEPAEQDTPRHVTTTHSAPWQIPGPGPRCDSGSGGPGGSGGLRPTGPARHR